MSTAAEKALMEALLPSLQKTRGVKTKEERNAAERHAKEEENAAAVRKAAENYWKDQAQKNALRKHKFLLEKREKRLQQQERSSSLGSLTNTPSSPMFIPFSYSSLGRRTSDSSNPKSPVEIPVVAEVEEEKENTSDTRNSFNGVFPFPENLMPKKKGGGKRKQNGKTRAKNCPKRPRKTKRVARRT